MSEGQNQEHQPYHPEVINHLSSAVVRALELGAEQEARAEIAEERAKLAESKTYADDKTILVNEKGLAESYKSLRARRARHPLHLTEHVLIYMDIDNFKEANDTLGHSEGDRIIKQVGDLLKNHLRESDTPARLHGDEFAILMPYTMGEEAVTKAEEIRNLLAEQRQDITLSMGIAVVDLEKDMDENLHIADTALLAAKKHHDGTIVMANDLTRETEQLNLF